MEVRNGYLVIPGHVGYSDDDIAWLKYHLEELCEIRVLVGPKRSLDRPPNPGLAECCGTSGPHGRGVCRGRKKRTNNSGPW